MINLSEYERQKTANFLIRYQGKEMFSGNDLKEATETFHRYFHQIPLTKIHNLEFLEGEKFLYQCSPPQKEIK